MAVNKLKELLNKARNLNPSRPAGMPPTQPANGETITNTPTILPMLAATYGLPSIKETGAELAAILRKFADLLEAGQITDADKKAMILTFYRLAFMPDERAKGVFHPSQIALENSHCRRKLYYERADVKYDKTFRHFTEDNRMMRLVDLGTLVHLYVQENLKKHLILKDFEVKVNRPDCGIIGKTDGVVTFFGNDDLGNYYDPEDMILEIKTINDRGFEGLKVPKLEHVKQASIYGHLLGYKRICFIYYNKNTSAMKIMVRDIMVSYVEDFMLIAQDVIALYNKNCRVTRTTDIKQHQVYDRVCSNIACDRARECPYAGYCFKN